MRRAPVVCLTENALDLEALGRSLEMCATTGGVASFAGFVRGGDGLTALELQHHPVLTRTSLDLIAETAMRQFDLSGLVVAHRFGRMPVGAPIVYIAAGAPHRRAAFDAVSYTIDVLKTQAPFWKREWRGEAAMWIEPTASDLAAAETWMEALK